MTDFNLGDIPDLSVIDTGYKESDPIQDGWYKGTILEKREFTDKNGNDRVFESSDTPANRSGRNIRLQVQLTRKSDGKTFHIGTLVNYKPEYLTPETVAKIAERAKENSESGAEWGDLFAPFMTLTKLNKLQQIAGVRSFKRTEDGALDITPLFNKTGYFRVTPDKQKPAYKAIDLMQVNEPKRVPVL